MPWLLATLISAIVLGFYDLCIKHSVRDNAVLPVLFLSNLCSAIIWTALMCCHAVNPAALPTMLAVPPLSVAQHAEILVKSALVATAWTCSYFGIKHLPLSIGSPIRATAPIWTFFGALALLHEHPTILEILGIVVTLASFVGLSLAGRQEGIHFHRNKWIWWLCLGTIVNGISGLYDKYLLGRWHFTPATVQAWFSIYLAALFLPLAVGWKMRWWPRHEFHWRWSILAVSFTLLVADFIYFDALRDPNALVSVVSSLRRGSTLVAFIGGLWWFKETNGRRKLPAVIGVLIGIVLTIL